MDRGEGLFWQKYEKEVLEEVYEEEAQNRPVLRFMRAVRFFSLSRGRGRNRRIAAREVVLIQYGSDRSAGRWRFWTGEDRHDDGRLPWDQWATEIYGDFCDQLSQKGVHPDDYLRSQVVELLQQFGGRF